jgi:D-glycerate 3-kinase
MPEDYHYSLQWRIEAEHKLMATGKSGMNDQEISQFVEYFWKALHPELFMPHMINCDNGGAFADLVVEISRSHLPIKISSRK